MNDRDYVLDTESIRKIINNIKSGSLIPIDLIFRGTKNRQLQFSQDEVKNYDFMIGYQGHTKYLISIGMKDAESIYSNTVFSIIPLKDSVSKDIIYSVNKDNGAYFSMHGEWSYHVLRTAIALAQEIIRTILYRYNLILDNINTKGMLDDNVIKDTTQRIKRYQEIFDTSQLARPKKKVARFAPRTRYIAELSNHLESKQVNRIMDTVKELSDQMGINIRYRSRYLLGQYDWRYKFTLGQGINQWDLFIGTSSHYNDDQETDIDQNEIIFTFQNHHSLKNVVSEGGRHMNMQMTGRNVLYIFLLGLNLSYQVLNAIYSLPSHHVDQQKMKRLEKQEILNRKAHRYNDLNIK